MTDTGTGNDDSELEVLRRKLEISEEQKKRILRQQIEHKVAHEILNRKWIDTQNELEELKILHQTTKEELEAVSLSEQQKEQQLNQMAQKLLVYKEKLAHIEIKLVKFTVQQPKEVVGEEKVVLSILKNPSNGKFWFCIKDKTGETRVSLQTLQKVVLSKDKPHFFFIYFKNNGEESKRTFISESRMNIAATVEKFREVCNEDL